MIKHEEYVQSVRKRIVGIARQMLDGSLPYLEGAIRLDTLLAEAGLSDNDPDLTAFKLVASEVDHLPIGAVREHWSEEALKKIGSDIERATTWARETTIEECRSLIARFSR